MSLVGNLISKHHSKGILIDTNILLLFFIGIYDKEFIDKFKRTSKYSNEDFEIVKKIILKFKNIIITPHILTEISNLSFQMSENLLKNYFLSIIKIIKNMKEIYIDKNEIIESKFYIKIGFADSSIIECAWKKGILVFTDDFPLSNYLLKLKCDVINLNYIRTEVWSVN